jgi:hypothetical protein
VEDDPGADHTHNGYTKIKDIYRENRTKLDDGRWNAKMGRYKQLKTPMQNLTHKCQNDRKKKRR